ncbi:MAG: peptidase, partial [Lentisphaeria bacterium]|nr:peptidase [Lentisphaeria bacterium]
MALTPEMLNEAGNLHLEALQIVRDLCHIPAPSGHEEKRAEYCKNYFEKNGFKNVTVDDALNV